MPKHKLASTSSSIATTTTTVDNQQEIMAQSVNETGQPAATRLRVPHLNFSIESMMQPAANQQQQQQQQQQVNSNPFAIQSNGNKLARDSRSPSPSGSDAGSAISDSSSSNTTGTLGSPNGRDTTMASHNHLTVTIDAAESLASSRSSSRVSTPISPGCNSSSGHVNGRATINNAISANSEQFIGAAHHNNQSTEIMRADGAAPNHSKPVQMNQMQNNNNNHHHQAPGTSMSHQQQVSRTNESGGVGKVSKSSRSTNSRIRPVCTDSRLAPFECHLDNLELWHRFHPLDTEMIITKQGRRMFPPVRVTFSFNDQVLWQQEQEHKAAGNKGATAPQFNSRDKYQVLMDILPYDNKRYRYAYHKSSWQQAGKADPPSPTKLFLHPDGPFTLDQLRRQVISFEKIKLTNNDANKHGYIVLNSMHKYQPRIHLILWRGKESQNLVNAPVNLLDMEAHKTFVFSETIFTAVTAYQNHSITKLKIDSNPFAKGFRDSTRLTDLELESMQDLMADGQCPFSPPRAPPPGFPHFLFAAAQHPQFGAYGGGGGGPHQPPPPQFTMGQSIMGGPALSGLQTQSQQGGASTPTSKHEDATAALLRERTIMALDSFLQQQHQQHQQTTCGPGNSGSPQSMLPPGGPNNGNQQRATGSSASDQQRQQSSPSVTTTATMCQFSPFGNPHGSFPPPMSQAGPQPPVSMAQQQQQQQRGQLEQFLMQQQQQFAAAMAAAAAASQAAGPQPPPPHLAYHPLQSLFAQAAAQQQQQQLASPTAQTGGNNKLGTSPPPPSSLLNVPLTTSAPITTSTPGNQPAPHDQTSPIGAAKSAARMLDLSNFLSAPLGGATGGAPPSAMGQHQPALHPHHLQALIQHHQQQMAALAHHNQQHNATTGCHLSQLEPQQQQQLLMAEASATNGAATPVSARKATVTKNK